jgi:hypothetical protein
MTKSDTPSGFFNMGLPTYIVGTKGDDHSDRAISGQAELIRSLLTPDAKKLDDQELLDFMIANGKWPQHPVVYGGSHVNATIAAIEKDLPFSITAGKLTIGDHTFEGDGFALITVVPARAGKYPEFLLYAGTGTPGIAEINSPSVARVDAPIVIADAFGPLVVGSWSVGADGVATPKLNKPGRRVSWRETTKEVAGAKVSFRFFDGAPAVADGPAIADASRGIEIAMKKLAPDRPIAFTIYIHPDQRSKGTLTGNSGAGHVTAFARTLHVYMANGLEQLVAHEATHVIAPQIWPPPGSPLFGEGLAVWVSDGYAGRPLASYSPRLQTFQVEAMLGAKFRSTPEGEAYPFAGHVVRIAVTKVGLAKVRDHLYGATTATWRAACERAGTTWEAIDAAIAALPRN